MFNDNTARLVFLASILSVAATATGCIAADHERRVDSSAGFSPSETVTVTEDELRAASRETTSYDEVIANASAEDLYKSKLIGAYLVQAGILEDVVAEGARVSQSLRKTVLFSDMDLSAFGVPDTLTLEMMMGAHMEAASIVAPQESDLTYACCMPYACKNDTKYVLSNAQCCSYTPIACTYLYGCGC
jgi:hypothetical protein